VDPKAGLGAVERRKFLPYRDSNSDPSVVEPVASRYTDNAIRAPVMSVFVIIYFWFIPGSA
jgi:hypothetical protein